MRAAGGLLSDLFQGPRYDVDQRVMEASVYDVDPEGVRGREH